MISEGLLNALRIAKQALGLIKRTWEWIKNRGSSALSVDHRTDRPIRCQRLWIPAAWVIPHPADDLSPAPPENQGVRAQWARQLGGVDAVTRIRIILQGADESAVVVEDLRIEVIGRDPPLSGTLVRDPRGGPLEARAIKINLDETPPTPQLLDSWSFPLRVSSQDVEVLYLFTEVQTCDCRWVAELDWNHQGQQRTTRIDDHGEPFRTTAAAPRTPTYMIIRDGSLVPAPENLG